MLGSNRDLMDNKATHAYDLLLMIAEQHTWAPSRSHEPIADERSVQRIRIQFKQVSALPIFAACFANPVGHRSRRTKPLQVRRYIVLFFS
jgi:hypothetical protein